MYKRICDDDISSLGDMANVDEAAVDKSRAREMEKRTADLSACTLTLSLVTLPLDHPGAHKRITRVPKRARA